MDYKLCTLRITDAEGWERLQTVFLNSAEFRRLISEGAELLEIIE